MLEFRLSLNPGSSWVCQEKRLASEVIIGAKARTNLRRKCWGKDKNQGEKSKETFNFVRVDKRPTMGWRI